MNRKTKRFFNKALSSILAAIYIGTIGLCFCSCINSADNSKRDEVIVDGTPWFESEITTYGSFSEKEYLTPVLIDKENRVFFHLMEDSGEEKCCVEVFKKNIDKQHTIVIEDLSVKLPIVYEHLSVFSVSGDLFVSVNFGNYDEEKLIIYKLNLDTDSLERCKELSFNDSYHGIYIEKIIAHDGYNYALFSYLEGDYYHYGFKVFSNDWMPVYETTVQGQIEKWSVNGKGDIVAFERINSILNAVGFNIKENNTYSINIKDAMLNKYQYGYFMNDGRIYNQNADLTITCYDFDLETEQVVIDYNNCNANISQLADYTLFYVDSEGCSFIKSTFYFGERNISNTVLDIDRTTKNPNKGKTVIYAAPSGVIDPMVGEGILEYNRSNSEYYIKVTMNYSIYNTERREDFSNVSEYWSDYYLRNNMVVDALIQDIKNGTAPDILLDFGQFPYLYSDEYMLDLSDISSELSNDEYFNNIIDSFKINNSLFQMPLTAVISGLYVDRSALGNDIKKFDFHSYDNFVNNECGGVDPIGTRLGRDNYMRLLLMYHYNELHNERSLLTIDNELFRRLCMYVKNSPNQMSDVSGPVIYLNCSFFAYDLSTLNIKEGVGALMGFPSSNGTGAMAECPVSVAVSKCSKHAEAAKAFAKNLISYEVQSKCLNSNPINKKAFEDIAKKILPYVNTAIHNSYSLKNYYSKEIIAEYEGFLSSADCGGLFDTYTMKIINEEIPAYYEEQKDIDSIIPIIENRVNNMIKERE